MTEWLGVCRADELRPGDSKVVYTNNTEIALFNIDGEFYAMENRCTHQDFPLLMETLDPQLQIDGSEITCPHHGAVFCIKTGEALSPPAYEPVTTYEIRIEGEELQILTGNV